MSEPAAQQQPPRRPPTAYATVKDFYARFDRRALAWYCRNDLPAMPLPDPPAAIQNLSPPERRQRTLEVWQATYRLLQALDAWQDWFRKLRAQGDAEPASALWCQETALQSVRVLCTHRVNAPPFDRETEAHIVAMLPPMPDWSMAGTDYLCDQEQDQPIASPRPRWQDDPTFFARYYGGPGSRWETSTRLRGATLRFLLLLERSPMTALPSDSSATTHPAVQQAVGQVIERINCLHRLAVSGLNAVLRLHTLRHFADGDRHAQETLVQLQQAVQELADPPAADDPFAADEVVEAAGVVATSMHAAALDLARRTWHTVQLRSLAPGSSSDHHDASGQPYTRITSPLLTRAPTEVPWSADVWRQVCQQLAKEPTLDRDRIQARLALERMRAVRQLEARFGVHLTDAGVISSAIGPTQLASVTPVALAAPPAAEQTTPGTLAQSQPPAVDDPPFLLSELQERILAALDRKALTLDALAAKLDVERSSLHRDGIKELRKRGLIDNHRRAGGYYRPDAPPPRLADKLRKKSP